MSDKSKLLVNKDNNSFISTEILLNSVIAVVHSQIQSPNIPLYDEDN